MLCLGVQAWVIQTLYNMFGITILLSLAAYTPMLQSTIGIHIYVGMYVVGATESMCTNTYRLVMIKEANSYYVKCRMYEAH